MITWTWFGWWRSWVSKLWREAVPVVCAPDRAPAGTGKYTYYLLEKKTGARMDLGCTAEATPEQAERFRANPNAWEFCADPPIPIGVISEDGKWSVTHIEKFPLYERP